MAGATTVQAFPYPFLNEAATPVSVQNLANQIDTRLTAKDTARSTAMRRDTARINRISGSISLAINTINNQTFDTESWDVGGLANLGVNNERITIVKTGLYYVHGSYIGTAMANTATVIEAAINRNGTSFIKHKESLSDLGGAGTQDRYIQVAGVKSLTAGDIIQLQAFWNGSGGGPYNLTTQSLTVRLIAV
jgi:hypothetical protein